LKLQYDETLSNFAFNFNLRRYTEVVGYVLLWVTPQLGAFILTATMTAGAYIRLPLSST
jgi:hypothetical protein